MKYNGDEARRLKNMGQLPESVNVSFQTSHKKKEDFVFFEAKYLESPHCRTP